MAYVFLFFQILSILCATVSSLRPALLPRQFEPCGTECGGGWCCAEFEACVEVPQNTDGGGWGCVFQGITNDNGSPITDAPYNPSADAAVFSSISDLIASITAEFSITSLPSVIIPPITEATKSTTTSRVPNPASPTVAFSTSTIPPQPSSSSAAQSQPLSSPEMSSTAPALEPSASLSGTPLSFSSSSLNPFLSSSETSAARITTIRTNSTPSTPTPTPVPSTTPFVSGANVALTTNRNYLAFMTLLVGTLMMAYLV